MVLAPPVHADFNVKQMYFELTPRLRVAVARQRQEAALDQLHLLPPTLAPKQRLLAQKALAAASVPALLQAGQLLSEASYEGGVAEEPGWWGVAQPPSAGPFCYLLDEGTLGRVGAEARNKSWCASSGSGIWCLQLARVQGSMGVMGQVMAFRAGLVKTLHSACR